MGYLCDRNNHTTMKLKPGTLLQGGRYRIIDTLGQGGFGITYRAEQIMAHRTVCIKEFFPKQYYNRSSESCMISLGSKSNAETMARFKQKFIKEAQTIASLDHDNIIQIYDVFEENNTAYYVMEYIEGMSLNMLVNKLGALGVPQAKKYISEIASALDYIHGLKINHLDIKPSNIMIRVKDNRAILIDFGLSKHYDDAGEQTSSTPIGISHGYAPMEQYKAGGVSKFSPATDIYSLGATLYNLVTGCTPPHASDILISGVPHHRFIDNTLYDILTHALAPNPKDRPQSISEFMTMCEPLPSEDIFRMTEQTALTNIHLTIDESEPQEPTHDITLKNEKHDHEEMDEGTDIDADYEPKESKPSYEPKVIASKPTTNANSNSKQSGCIGWFMSLIAVITAVSITIICIIKYGGHGEHNSLSGISDNDMQISAMNAEEVDLGLSVNWATYNVGATAPEEYGEYYGWGEIEPNSSYNSHSSSTYGNPINDYDRSGYDNISGSPMYDAATIAWGDGWRTPTQEEFQELLDECQWEWMYDYNGVEGYLITSPPPTARSIFLPAGGYYDDKLLEGCNEYCRYWSSTFDTSYNDIYDGYRLKCDPIHGKYINDLEVWYGMNIRPVKDK